MSLRVLLIDDHTLFRVGLLGLLEHRGIQVVAAVGDGAEGLRLAQELKPDVILLDMRLPGMNGIDVLRQLRSTGMTMPVVMLTTSSNEQDLVESLRSGAQGYLIKDTEPDEVVVALRDIMAAVAADSSDPFSDLTPRESEILGLLAEGQSNKMIARNLGISDGTVKLHVKSILRKLGVHSRVEAAVIAVEQGLHSNRISALRSAD